jgi:hypothetical protein
VKVRKDRRKLGVCPKVDDEERSKEEKEIDI